MVQSAFAARRAANLKAIHTASPEDSIESPAITTTAAQGSQIPKDEDIPRRKRRKLHDGSTVPLGNPLSNFNQDLNLVTAQILGTNHDSIQATGINRKVQAIRELRVDEQRSASPVPKDDLAQDPPRPSISLDLVWNDAYNAVDIKLRRGQSIFIVGEYDLWVKKGSIRLLGAIIHASSRSYRVYSPTTQAIPPVEALSNPFGPSSQDIEIHVSSCSSGLRRLQRCEPRFARIWHRNGGNLASFEAFSDDHASSTSSFQAFQDWQTQISKLLDYEKPAIVMICGPKNVGKSTFARYLSNSFLSRRFADAGIAYLDLDPGQPEYTTPADLSLSHVKTFNFGPPFTHPVLIQDQGSKALRQHHYGHFSPRFDSAHYLNCAVDLHQHYETSLKQAGCPLIVNTCGWVQGLGLDLIDSLVRRIRPSHIVSFTSPENDETSRTLQSYQADLLTLQSRNHIPGSRSGSDLRTMQHCSYFHLDDSENGLCHWKAEPLLKSQPLSLSYAGDDKVISGILLLGEQLNYEMLEDAVNGSILALVAIEDSSVLSDALLEDREKVFEYENTADDSAIGVQVEKEQEYTNQQLIPDESEGSYLDLQERYMLHTNSRGLPFLSTVGDINPPLDPSKTRSLGQVLLCGIDHDQRVVRMHTQLSLSMIHACIAEGMSLILVRGQLGMPDWAYSEEYIQTKAMKEDIKALQALQEADMIEDTVDFDVVAWAERTPYIEYQDTQESRNRSKVRRVRRNLGGK